MNEDILLASMIGFAFGVMVFYYLLKILLRRMNSRLEEMLAHIEQSQIEVRLELDRDLFYMYNKETNEFMAQGCTLAELRDIVQKRWPNKSVVFSASEDQEIFNKLKATINENSTSI
jgi:hypothetical protein